MVKFDEIIKSLSSANVEYVIVSELATYLHRWKTVSAKLEICYLRTDENLDKIFNALSPYNPRLRNLLSDLPYDFDKSSLRNEKNFIFETDIGDIDLLNDISGIGNFQKVLADSETISVYGFDIRILTIEGLIKSLRASGSPRDLLIIPELEALKEVLSNKE